MIKCLEEGQPTALKMKRKLLLLIVAFVATIGNLSAHNRLAVEYTENRGQWDHAILFRAGLGTGSVFLERERFVFSFYSPQDLDQAHEYNRAPWLFAGDPPIHGHAWYMKFDGAQFNSATGLQKQSDYANYFIGNDPSKWASDVGIYAGVEYTSIYPGINLHVHQGSGNFKYDFKVAPGASPDAIRLVYEGLNGMEIRDGQLVMHTSVGEFIENRPFAFQVIQGSLVEVPCNYVISGESVTFAFPEGYDVGRELIIDPELIAATLSGGSGTVNYGHSATFDIAGNMYTGCISFGNGYPASPGAFDTTHNGSTDFGLMKLNPTGTTRLWATYIGGSSGEYPHSLWASDQGELFVYGSSSSTNFPTTAGAYDTTHNGGVDIVVCKLSPNGNQLLASTYIGGNAGDGQNSTSVNYGDTYRGEIILDPAGRVLITSCTSSANFPVTPGAFQPAIAGGQDAVFCRLSNNLGSLEVSTFIGSSGNDMGFGLRVNTSGNVFICGMAGGANFPTTPGAHQTTFLGGGAGGGMDGFVLRLNANATSLQRSTLLATSAGDQCFFIDLDNSESVYVYGQGGNFPVVGQVYSNPGSTQFITKLNPDLSTVLLSTVVGSGGQGWGSYDFVPDAFLVDLCNNIYISSYRAEGQLPLTSDALYNDGGFYLAVFSDNLASLEYATFYTGDHVDGGTSRFDKNGTVYQAVCSGGGFATTPGAWASSQSIGWDIAIFKIDFDVSGVNSAITVPELNGCAPYLTEFQNFSVGDQFFWDFGDGNTSTEFEPVHTYEAAGVYTIMMIASDELSCNLADTSIFVITISTPVEYYPSFEYTMDCESMSVTTNNTTGYDFLQYIWNMGDGTVLQGENVTHSYGAPGEYQVALLAVDNGCDSDEEAIQTVVVFNEVIAVMPPIDLEGCAPYTAVFTNNSPGAIYTWDFGDGSPLQSGNSVSHQYTQPGDYTLTLYADGTDGCIGSDTAATTIVVIAPPPVDAAFAVTQTDECVLMRIEGTNLSTGDDVTYLWNFGDGTSSTLTDAQHAYTQPGTYIISLTVEDLICGTTDVATSQVTLIDQIDLQLPPVQFICHYEEGVTLTPVSAGPGTTYEWSTGETTATVYVNQTGSYSVTAFFNNCEYTHHMEVERSRERTIFEEVKFCEGSNQYLEIPHWGGSWYSWCTGESTQGITVENGGEYCFQYIDGDGCLQEGRIWATLSDFNARVFVPNSFSPNNDGINDAFFAQGTGVTEFEMTIWNRWGDEIFKTTEFADVWDGSFEGKDHYVQNEVYTWKIRYRGDCNPEPVEKVGVVTMIR